MDREKKQKIKEIVEKLIGDLGVESRIEESEEAQEMRFVVRTRDARMLIGMNGANLLALNYLVKKIALKQIFGDVMPEEQASFSIDVNDYLKQKNDNLREMARMHAQRVRYFKKEVLMPPMNSHDRRIVHAALTEYPDIVTESSGKEPSRCVVIKPYNI